MYFFFLHFSQNLFQSLLSCKEKTIMILCQVLDTVEMVEYMAGILKESLYQEEPTFCHNFCWDHTPQIWLARFGCTKRIFWLTVFPSANLKAMFSKWKWLLELGKPTTLSVKFQSRLWIEFMASPKWVLQK